MGNQEIRQATVPIYLQNPNRNCKHYQFIMENQIEHSRCNHAIVMFNYQKGKKDPVTGNRFKNYMQACSTCPFDTTR